MDQRTSVSFLQSWPAHLATAVATGVVTAYLPVQRWSPVARWSLHGGLTAVAAGGVAFAVRHPERLRHDAPEQEPDSAPRQPLGWVGTTAAATAIGALVLTASRGGEAADEWAERALARRGVRRPRVWMGVAAAGISLAMSLADARRDARERLEDPGTR